MCQHWQIILMRIIKFIMPCSMCCCNKNKHNIIIMRLDLLHNWEIIRCMIMYTKFCVLLLYCFIHSFQTVCIPCVDPCLAKGCFRWGSSCICPTFPVVCRCSRVSRNQSCLDQQQACQVLLDQQKALKKAAWLQAMIPDCHYKLGQWNTYRKLYMQLL